MAIINYQTSLSDIWQFAKLGGLERFSLAIKCLDDEPLMRRLEGRRGHGRNDYPVRVMWHLMLALMVFGHRTVEPSGGNSAATRSSAMFAG